MLLYFIKSDHVRFVIFLLVCNFRSWKYFTFHFSPEKTSCSHFMLTLALYIHEITFWTRCYVVASVCLRSHSKCIWFSPFLSFTLFLFTMSQLILFFSVFYPKVNVGPIRFFHNSTVLIRLTSSANFKALRAYYISLPPPSICVSMWLLYLRSQTHIHTN